jgi:hypothetical protein
MAFMASRPLLTTLLSQALVAFTIEFDNEAEHRLPHRTTLLGKTPGSGPAPWLVSMAMGFNCMRYVGEEGIALQEMEWLARSGTNLDGMQRWGYIYLEPAPDDPRPKPPKRDWLVRSLPGGRRARAIWEPLFPEIEGRWQQRFGADRMNQLREALVGIAGELDPNLPDCMPIVGYGLFTAGPNRKANGAPAERDAGRNAEEVRELPLPALLARILVAIARGFDDVSPVSLCTYLNILRVLDDKPSAIADLPMASGVSKEMIAVGIGWLARHGFAQISSSPAPKRGKEIGLNEKGLLAQEECRKRLLAQENALCGVMKASMLNQLRDILEVMVQDGSAVHSPLFAGLNPYPEGWRAKVRKPESLPHFPVVSHRGGFPDGS